MGWGGGGRSDRSCADPCAMIACMPTYADVPQAKSGTVLPLHKIGAILATVATAVLIYRADTP